MKYLFIIMVLLFAIPTSADCLSDIIIHLLRDNPNHKLYKDEEARKAFISDIELVTSEYNQDSVLAVYMAFKESGFNRRAKGDLKKGVYRSHGLFQFGYTVRKQCTRQGFKLSTRIGQIQCYSYWLQRLQQKNECKSLVGALRAYVSKGGSCRGTPKGRRIVRSRLWKVKQLKKQFCLGVLRMWTNR